MAYSAVSNNSVQPLGLPDTGSSQEMGDSWNEAVAKINANFAELYARTGGQSSLSNNLPSPLNNSRNAVVGGDFSINPWQRGTSFSNIAATAVYTADRFFVAGMDASVSAKAARAAFSSTAGFNQSFRFGRANTASSLSAIVTGQIMESGESIRYQGQTVCLSFYALSEANFSAASGNLGVSLIQGTGTDQSAASALAGTWTAQANAISSLQAITSTMTRYSFSGTISNNTAQLGVLLQYTPVGSAGAADSVLLQGVQLEVGSGPSLFEHRDVETELARCQRFCFAVSEPVSGIVIAPAIAAGGPFLYSTIPLPVPMRVAPTSVQVTNGSFGFQRNGTYAAGTGLAALAAGHTVNGVNITLNGTAVSNTAAMLVGASGIGAIVASAEY